MLVSEATKPYMVLRAWKDGEVMESHVMAEFDAFDAAQNYQAYNGGYIQRAADGATWTPISGWVKE